MNHTIMSITTIINFISNKLKLDWAKNNLDENTYKKIKKSYFDTIKYTAAVVLFLSLIYFFAIMSQIKTIDKYSSNNTRTAHVSGEKIWYIQNDKKEINLSDYGYDYKDYSNNEQFVVYLDKDYNIINISPLKDAKNEMNSPYIVMAVGLILFIIIILFIYMPICSKTFGKNWKEFCRWYNKADLSQDKFIL